MLRSSFLLQSKISIVFNTKSTDMKKVLVLFLIVLASCNTKDKITYQISLIDKNEKPALQVEMSLNANPNGETTLFFQDKAWGQEELYNTLTSISSKQANEIVKEKDSNRIIIKHEKGIKTLNVTYTIQQDTEGNITTRDTYRPIVQKNYFQAFAHGLFMLPNAYLKKDNPSFNVTIKWINFKEDYNIVNSFNTNERTQYIKNTNQEKFSSSVFTGGDYTPYIIDVKGNKAVLSIRGEWENFQDSTLVNILDKTLHAQRDLWQDHSQKYFAVTMTPTYLEQGSSFGGTGLTNSFATTASNNKDLEVDGLVYLFNHELQHNWIGHLIKNDNEEEQYWFSEGFTDYFTIKNIAKNNIHNLDKSYFFKEFNVFIKALYTSPVKEAPNSEINYDNFWKSRDYGKLPYRRGALFAFYLDNKIKSDSKGEKSLDDLILAIKDDAINTSQKITHSYFLAKANQFLNEDLTPFFKKHIEDGKLYDLKTIFDDFGYDYNPKTEAFYLGFTFTDDNLYIKDIDVNSNAYKSGLRKGDRTVKWSYYRDYPEYPAQITILKDNKEVVYSFDPIKLSEIPTLKDNDNNKKALPF